VSPAGGTEQEGRGEPEDEQRARIRSRIEEGYLLGFSERRFYQQKRKKRKKAARQPKETSRLTL
jgi:hypothetical protein